MALVGHNLTGASLASVSAKSGGGIRSATGRRPAEAAGPPAAAPTLTSRKSAATAHAMATYQYLYLYGDPSPVRYWYGDPSPVRMIDSDADVVIHTGRVSIRRQSSLNS
jgi:hypothetical protein